jgi:hypothetical protein
MVAFTTDDLPYQEDDDRMCDMDTTWCEFAFRADQLLQDRATVIGRYNPARPAAQLIFEGAVPISSTIATNIAFDGAVFDTDGLYDPARNPNRLFLRRPGVWFLDGWVRIGSGGTFPVRYSLYLTSELFGPNAIPGSSTLSNVEEDVQITQAIPQQYNRISTFLQVTEADIASSNGHGLGISPNFVDTFVLGQARLGAYFMREVLS